MATVNPVLTIKTNSILEDYDVYWNQKLGTGISGPVRPCVRKKTGERFALKCLLDRPKSRTEATLHYKCSNHPNIVTVYDVYANDVQFPGEPIPRPRLFVVMELMEGGELFDRISQKKRFTEREAAHYTRQIAAAVSRCHSLNVAHRDLKPENLLLKDNSEDAAVKLSDFGFAKIDDGNLTTPQFTPYYVAPQILEAQIQRSQSRRVPNTIPYTYDKSCDMWSLGVIIYIMLCGYPPFYSETPSKQMTKNMKLKILAGEYNFPKDEWGNISIRAKEVITSLLNVEPESRMTIEELVSHPWLHEAPNTVLCSPVVMLDKQAFEEACMAHSQHLTNMRLPDVQVTLKPIGNVNNPMLKKRLLNMSNESKSLEEPPKKQSSDELAIQKLQELVAYLVENSISDTNTQEDFCHLVSQACRYNSDSDELEDLLKAYSWNGAVFEGDFDKGELASSVQRLISHRRPQEDV